MQPSADLQRDPSWPKEGDKCEAGDTSWYPLDITAVSRPNRKLVTPRTSSIVQGRLRVRTGKPTSSLAPSTPRTPNWRGNRGDIPKGWLESVGAVKRAYMPVAPSLSTSTSSQASVCVWSMAPP
nr:hypothetical protein [Corynebacterium tuberculostearicum]